MKKHLLIIVLLSSFLTASLAQQKIDKYCNVTVASGWFASSKGRVYFSGGREDSLFSFKDPSVYKDLSKVQTLQSVPDVMNYMSLLGWNFVSIVVDRGLYNLYFRRTFDLSELAGH